MNRLNSYIVEIGCALIGFYLMAVVLAVSNDNDFSIIEVLNSIGIFLSSIGVVAAILTVLQQAYNRRDDAVKEEVNIGNFLQFKLGFVFDVYHSIVEEMKYAVQKNDFRPRLLDGKVEDYLLDFNFESLVFISKLDDQLLTDVCYSVFNHNRFVAGVFRWQSHQERCTDIENIKDFNDRSKQLEEFACALVNAHLKLFSTFRQAYPEDSFFKSNVDNQSFISLPKFNKQT